MRHRRTSALTLLELLIAMAYTVLIVGAMAAAYGTAMTGPSILATRNASFAQGIQYQTEITDYLRHAYMYTLTADPNCYFTSNPVSNPPTNAGTNTSSNGLNGGSSGTSQISQYGGSQQLVFTALGLSIPAAYLHSSSDFPGLNQTFGPSSGLAEVSFSLTPAGNANGQTGLFIRVQQPADSDPTQGGQEWLLIPGCTDVSFEFWDGTQWDSSWDTTTQTTKQLPSAVRVTYVIDDQEPQTFVVRIPTSNVTPQNPASQNSTTTGAGS